MPSSQVLLAEMHLRAEGTKEDLGRGLVLLELAAQQKHPQALYLLYVLHTEGLETDKNPELAAYYLELLRLEALHKNPHALYLMYVFHAEGVETDRNPELAMSYLRQSAQLGHFEAIQKLKDLEDK